MMRVFLWPEPVDGDQAVFEIAHTYVPGSVTVALRVPMHEDSSPNTVHEEPPRTIRLDPPPPPGAVVAFRFDDGSASELGPVLEAAGAVGMGCPPSPGPCAESFGDCIAEHHAVRRAAGLASLGALGEIMIHGEDRLAFLHALLTANIRSLSAGLLTPALFLTAKGKILADLSVLAFDDHGLLIVPGADVLRTLVELERYHIREDVILGDMSAEICALAIAGPQCGAALRAALGTEVPLPGRHVSIPCENGSATIAPWGDTGEPGALVLAWERDSVSLWERLCAAVRQVGGRPVGAEALETLRVEAGHPLMGKEMDSTTIPQEAGIAAPTISSVKGCYVGQEVMARIQTQGHVNRSLCGLLLDRRVPERGAIILRDGREVGVVTSAIRSPTLGRPVALGYVRSGEATAGTKLVVRGPGGEEECTISPLPLVEPGRHGG